MLENISISRVSFLKLKGTLTGALFVEISKCIAENKSTFSTLVAQTDLDIMKNSNFQRAEDNLCENVARSGIII